MKFAREDCAATRPAGASAVSRVLRYTSCKVVNFLLPNIDMP